MQIGRFRIIPKVKWIERSGIIKRKAFGYCIDGETLKNIYCDKTGFDKIILYQGEPLIVLCIQPGDYNHLICITPKELVSISDRDIEFTDECEVK